MPASIEHKERMLRHLGTQENRRAILAQIQIIAAVPQVGTMRHYIGHQNAAAIIDAIDRAGFVIVAKAGRP